MSSDKSVQLKCNRKLSRYILINVNPDLRSQQQTLTDPPIDLQIDLWGNIWTISNKSHRWKFCNYKHSTKLSKRDEIFNKYTLN